MQISTIAKSARPPFLILTPVCILFAYAIAMQQVAQPNLADTLLILLGALAAHIAVNQLNEYQDFQSGLDLNTRRTPFSGGSGALPENPHGARGVLLSALICLALMCWVGIHFVASKGAMVLLPMGFLGFLLIIGYTKYVNRWPWLCLLAPGFGFGILMVLSSVILLGETITLSAALLALIPFLQVNNLLLLNQFPDIDADKEVGRNHFSIAYGVAAAASAFRLVAILPFVIIVGMIVCNMLPLLSAIALLTLIPAWMSAQAANKYQQNIAQHPQFMGMNVMVTLLTPTLLALSLLFAPMV